MNEYLGNCVINFNGAAFTGKVMYSAGDPEDEIDPAVVLEIRILDDFKEMVAEKLNCNASDIDVTVGTTPPGAPIVDIILTNGGGGDDGGGGGGAA